MGGSDKMKAQKQAKQAPTLMGGNQACTSMDIKSAAPLIDRKQACTVRIENWWLLEKRMSGSNLVSVSPCLEVGGAPPQ